MAKRGNKIKSIINKSEIARRLGLSPQYVGQLLNGKRKSAKRLQQINDLIKSALKVIVRDP